jgi:hypothetical protein
VSFNCPPILVVLFNRPDVLRQNLRALSRIAPKQLFLACDGPREGVPTDHSRVEECQCLALEMVDWDCNVETMFAERNHGCDTWVPEAVSWFFTRVASGIILEDDCVIDGDFARFAAELLEKYRDETRVMNISAANFQNNIWGEGDYYFSAYPSNWGWASWARAWKCYDDKLAQVEHFINTPRFTALIADSAQRRYWVRFYRALRSGKYTFWDSKWVLSIWAADGLAVAPNQNMVKNIGFGGDATHTQHDQSRLQRETLRPTFPLRHPHADLAPRLAADKAHFEIIYKPRLRARLKHLRSRLLDWLGQ